MNKNRYKHFEDQFGNTCSNYRAKRGRNAREWRRFVVFADSTTSTMALNRGLGWIAYGPAAGTETVTGHHWGDEAIKRAEAAACWLEDQWKIAEGDGGE